MMVNVRRFRLALAIVAGLAPAGALAQSTPITAMPNIWGALQQFSGGGWTTQTCAVTANTTQTRAGALLSPLCQVSVVNAANASDAVGLPSCTVANNNIGAWIVVITVGSTATPVVWAATGGSIDGGTNNVTLTAAHRGASFYCVSANTWISQLFGAVAS
jgi:hypothetical protein